MDADARHVIEGLVGKVQALKMELAALESEKSTPIAIVGIGCRFPGEAAHPAAFWHLLDAGRDVAEPLADRWSMTGAPPPATGSRWAGLLTEAVDRFDAAFFSISPREAQTLDPQQRLLLEVVWEALEEAGVPPESLAGSRTGVFVAACSNDYAQAILRQPRADRDLYAATGNALSVASGRVSYTFGFEGPCMTVDAACSSSLVAVHLACRSLRDRESDVALAGGVSLILSPDTMEGMQRMLAMSPDGRCRTFDAAANGMARGEGCGVVVLKRLSDARRDGDRIWALIRGSAVNQNGRSTGLSVPNVLAQEAVLRDALQSARVDAAAIGYVETHGAGSPVADVVEVEALRAVMGAARADDSRCVLGALKTNVGSLEAAGGVAGLIKVALSLHHERIPQNLHFRSLNPAIVLEGTALALASEPVPWPRDERPRLAGVSAFGMSGTNAHVVLEESPPVLGAPSSFTATSVAPTPAVGTPPALSLPPRSAELVVLSAKNDEALSSQAARLSAHLEKHPDLCLSDVALSLATTRSAMGRRLSLPARSLTHLREALDALARGDCPPGTTRGRAGAPAKVVFAFAGAEVRERELSDLSGWPRMGRELLSEEPVFRLTLEACDEAIRNEAGWSILEELAAPPETSRLERIEVRYPMWFALEAALGALWQSWGVAPDAIIGRGLGEVAAAHVSDALSLEDAVAVACRSSRLLQRLRDRGETPGHGPHAAAILSELHDSLAALKPRASKCAMFSARSEAAVSGTDLSAGYWADWVCAPADHGVVAAPNDLLKRGGALLEMDPRVPRASALEALGALWVKGHAVVWPQVFSPASVRVPLPTYAWQRERHWVELPVSAERPSLGSAASEIAPAPSDRHVLPNSDPDADVEAGSLLARLSACEPQARADLLQQFLRTHVSRLLRIAPDRLDASVPLGELGMDSVTGLELRQRLETALGVTVPAALSRTYPTMSAIAGWLVDHAFPDPAHATHAVGNAVRFRPAVAPRARLFCFHGAGGSPELFAEWATRAPRDVDVVAMWHMRDRSAILQPWQRYLDDVTALLLRDPEPFALVGLSLGGTFAWRVASEVAKRAPGRVPEAVFVVGSPLRHPGLGSDERTEFLARLYDQRIVGYQNAIQQVEADIESDLHLMTALGFPAGSLPLAIPVVAFGGQNDPMVPPGVIHEWGSLTRGSFSERLFPGDHAFMIERQAEIVRAVLGHFEALLRRRDGQASGGHRSLQPVTSGVPSP